MIHISHQYVVTVISHSDSLSSEQLLQVATALRDLRLTVLTERVLTHTSNRAIDYFVNIHGADPHDLATLLKQHRGGYDVIFQKADTRQHKKLFVFDMDSTLIYQEVIELIAAYAGIEPKVAEITERAMNGELDFNASLKERVQLLKGIDASTIWDELKHKIEITRGAPHLCKFLRAQGCVMAVCSGGFIPLAEHVKQELGLDYAYANVLGTDSAGVLDGTTRGEVVNGDKKAQLLLEIAARHAIAPADAVAVGDGANDLAMMAAGGFGIAWHAKPKVQQLAPCCLNTGSLQDVLYILGYTEAQQELS